MALARCPGQNMSRKKPEDVVCELPCPECGYKVEFFFDDKSRRCPECNTKVEKSNERLLKDFGCATWCSAAEECLGPKFYTRFNEAKERLIEEKKAHLRELLKNIPKEEKEVRALFIKAFKENTDIELLINPQKSIRPLNKDNPGLYKKVVKYYSEYRKSKKDGKKRGK